MTIRTHLACIAGVFAACCTACAAPPAKVTGVRGGAGAVDVTASRIVGDGNSVLVSGTGPGSNIVTTVERGRGNSVVVVRNGRVVDLDRTSYPGRQNRFWTKRKWSEELGRTLYWCPKTGLWFRYHADADCYRPDAELLVLESRRQVKAAEKEVADELRKADDLLRWVDRLLDGLLP